ncbi:MAG: multifunctional oxoglutarate decarboxylase/oxoglutarate dehydrogenase thiamine pyrophosphate-binding subunit/dihydrolipoyllysine-residue succinyltransferase subunit [Planctomycetes bacterium]|nr:multifunctional oxoglutarate decarboxylase/oxoglutarate dehydrogenase thiamine pyrophosphate-binding subunit/dihydrolipoyllysine-residue succinyltransferase subunit [Planctomycetota bacterium]
MLRPDFEEVFGLNAAYAEKVYGDYLAAPDSVPAEWRNWFEATLPPEQRAQAAGRPPSAPAAKAAAGPPAAAAPPADDELQPLAGVAGRIVKNMTESLTVPTATSTREIPVKVLEENRHAINRHQQGLYLPKVSFTHLIAWAMVRAMQRVPAMAGQYVEQDGKPFRRQGRALNLGIAVDLPGKGDGRRSLVVPNVKDAGALDFAGFLAAYNRQIDKARKGTLGPDDFAGTTCSLTNPGTIGTVSSLPRLMAGQAFILATGAIGVPGAFQGASPETLTELAVSRIMVVTSTYDHRVIQGAESGQFLDWLHRLLLGEEGFYDEVFRSLQVPYRPVRLSVDRRPPLGSSLREAENLERAAGLMTYIRSYRVRGHVLADLDPLRSGPGAWEPGDWPELDMSTYGLTLWDKERTFYSDGVTKKPFATLREIQEVLHLTYCRHVGAEFMHIADQERRHWLRERMEGNRNEEPLSQEAQLQILDKLVEAEAFEQFLHTRFVGHKRFSLEGGDTLIPVLDALLDRAAELGVQRAVLGMAHRGRLNVLAHVLKKPLVKIFGEFEGWLDPTMAQGSGDVKYHLGASADYATAGGRQVAVELACNPSHLEAVDPVVEGMARARQEQLPQDGAHSAWARVLPILVHGDAAFAGQGVVHETLQMSQLHGYRTGGTVHIVVNNQIGYTTSPHDSRSTPFCTDVAKGIQAPIFHVNGDDPLAAVRMVRLAIEYRARFHSDVVLDIVCYRRHGHNEGDEPSYTQPLLYRQIEAHPTVRRIYQNFLIRAGVLREEQLAGYDAQVQQRLKASLDEVRATEPPPVVLPEEAGEREWTPAVPPVPLERLQAWNARLLDWPADFTAHPKVKAVLGRRAEMLAGRSPVDFATAEALAFASLLTAGVPVRLAGQDSGRGTFSQRHAALHDAANGRRYVPLNHLEAGQRPFVVVDSLLSEEAALGFEYGYSTVAADALVLWEAQFGDFVNGAQIQIDQFLAAGEAKWGQASGLVLLLPHGYDGQGPEHSSARLERFLQLCAENNLRVANPTTAASYHHLLRAQALAGEQKPLVVMTPKSLLRMKEAGSAAEELATGRFAAVLDDGAADPAAVQRVVCCSGKVYYDLLEARGDDRGVALVRIELLYPWPAAAMQAVRARYPAATFVWCQEEPANMGAWTFVRDRFDWAARASRRAAASPATGSLQKHKAEQQALVAAALGRAGRR